MMCDTHLPSGQGTMYGMRFFQVYKMTLSLLSLEKSRSIMVKFCICPREAEQEQWRGSEDKTQFPIDRLALLRSNTDGAFSLKSLTPSLIGIVFARHFDKCHSVSSSEMSGCQHLSRIAQQRTGSHETHRVMKFFSCVEREIRINAT